MEQCSSLPGSPSAPAALREATPDRINQQRDSTALFSSLRSAELRDSSVHDKINQFNSLAVQSKQLERKTADAALKRAMLGREEAESELRRQREETKALRKQIDEGRERERKVGERLETVMENYGRAKETHAHTQSLWEKEIRRARKETFKSQSVIVKLQEELKSARSSHKTAEENLEREKERSRAREQEAFQARYSLVGLQEQLDQALEKLKTIEQERDAFKTLAKNEEDVARIAAEGRLPLPDSEQDEFSSPKKKPRVSSISIADVKSSATSEAEIEELTRLWQWERQRADRAVEHVEFLQTECQLKCCRGAKAQPQPRTASPRRKRPDPVKIVDAGDLPILSELAPVTSAIAENPSKSPAKSKTEQLKEQTTRRSTVFVPKEGIFRTVSQEEAAAMEEAQATQAAQSPERDAASSPTELSTPTVAAPDPPHHARTPSVDPPAFAILDQQRASLLSLLDAPQQRESIPSVFRVPTIPGPTALEIPQPTVDVIDHQQQKPEEKPVGEEDGVTGEETPRAHEQPVQPGEVVQPEEALQDVASQQANDTPEQEARPHTAAAFYAITTTTTMVPLREENTDPGLAARLLQLQRTPSAGSNRRPNSRLGQGKAESTFDTANPALTPTMTREQALAQIKERRGRARSAAQGQAVTPRKQMLVGTGVGATAAASDRRDGGAPPPGARAARRVRT